MLLRFWALACLLLTVTCFEFAAIGRRRFLSLSGGVAFLTAGSLVVAAPDTEALEFKRVQTQFIAALGEPGAQSGIGAGDWGVWRVDPGPRGVFLKDYSRELAPTQTGPYGWKFNPNDWWLEEHGIIMESPDFPLPPGRYVVTGGREMTTVLTVDENGSWALQDGTLYDVTHLPCRAARYNPSSAGSSTCKPTNAQLSNFPVRPGTNMPGVSGCKKQDYAVLFVIGVEGPSSSTKSDL